MTKGRSIRLFLVDGTPTGILTAEIMNWTGSTVVAPRARIADLVKREEVSRTGVYFLIGPDPETPSKSLVYIGESDNVRKRIIQHNKDETKDFWDRVCVVTSKDMNLTKAHVRYLESRMITIAQNAGRASLSNGTAPDSPSLPEADTSDMEFFIEQVGTVMPVLGFDFLKPKPDAPALKKKSEEKTPLTLDGIKDIDFDDIHVFRIDDAKFGVRATAVEIDGEFIVYAGSLARADSGAVMQSYRPLREKLIADGTLIKTDNPQHLEFSEDVAFASPSAAAAIVLHRNANGRTEWKVLGGKQTYADWQDEQIASAAQEDGE